jgi:hypothetical protein
MSKVIEDGTGTGNKAKVNGNQRLYVNGVVIDENLQATKIGNSYNVNSGIITLTDAVDTPIMYLKNNEEQSIHIDAIAVGIGPSTGGTGGIPKITVVRNPTAGTITTGSDVDINSNRNYGSSNTLTVDAKKGATGLTMTDGEDHIIFFQTSNGRLFATIDELLPKGQSIGIKFDPQASNTSQDVYAAIICHLEDPNE